MRDLKAAVGRVESGEVAAFEHIVSATEARLVRLAARILGNVSDAEDVVQEAYMKAYRAITLKQFDQRSNVSTWLYRIVLNRALDTRRTKSRSVVSSDSLALDAYAEEAALDTRLALKEIAELLGRLPTDQHAALLLKAVEGLNAQEIAEIMECSEGAVEQKLVRARAFLREIWSEP